MKQLSSTLFVLLCSISYLFGQVTLSVSSANPLMGDTFDIEVSVEGFDSLSSALFRLKWDPTIIQLEAVEMPVDTATDTSPFRSNADPDRITFLYDNANGTGTDGSLDDGSVLLRLTYVTIGSPGDSTCIMIDPSSALEFIKLASEELSVTVNTGCVHLQGVNSIPSHEHQKINSHWQTNDRLHVSHPPSAKSALIEVYTLEGRRLNRTLVAPQTTTTPILVSQDWQRTLLVVRYYQSGLSYTRLIAGPR